MDESSHQGSVLPLALKFGLNLEILLELLDEEILTLRSGRTAWSETRCQHKCETRVHFCRNTLRWLLI